MKVRTGIFVQLPQARSLPPTTAIVGGAIENEVLPTDINLVSLSIYMIDHGLTSLCAAIALVFSK